MAEKLSTVVYVNLFNYLYLPDVTKFCAASGSLWRATKRARLYSQRCEKNVFYMVLKDAYPDIGEVISSVFTLSLSLSRLHITAFLLGSRHTATHDYALRHCKKIKINLGAVRKYDHEHGTNLIDNHRTRGILYR